MAIVKFGNKRKLHTKIELWSTWVPWETSKDEKSL